KSWRLVLDAAFIAFVISTVNMLPTGTLSTCEQSTPAATRRGAGGGSGGFRRLDGGGVDGRDDPGSGLLDAVEGLSQRLGVAVEELDVVAGGSAGLQADRLADDEGDRLGLGLADGLAGRTVLAAVEQ